MGLFGLRAAYNHDVREALSRHVTEQRVAEADLEDLPEAVRRYLRFAGVVGRPRVHNMRVRMHGRFRRARDAPWMPLEAEQHNVFGEPWSRFFYMTASRLLIPFQAYHRYTAGQASMRVRLAGVVPVAQADGPVMTRSETVTMFNDMCVMAPATLIGAPVTWSPTSTPTRLRAAFANAGHTVHADLCFDEAGALVDFHSEDRSQLGTDGQPVSARWSTPVTAYRFYGPMRLLQSGQARWDDGQDWAYIELEIDEIAYNLPPTPEARGRLG